MKFLCDRCKTRYSIGDDRVRGKILKIRCKNCANVITVREGMTDADAGEATSDGGPRRTTKATTMAPPAQVTEPAPASTPAPTNGRGALGAAFASAMSNPAAKPPPALEEEWYVSIDGDQSGPFSLAEAQRWVANHPFDADLHCWSEGFDDWLPVDKVSHFRGIRKKPPAPATPPPLPRIGNVPRMGAAPMPAVEEETPKPLFAATMASLEKSPSLPAIKPPSVRATPADGLPARTNGSATPMPVSSKPMPGLASAAAAAKHKPVAARAPGNYGPKIAGFDLEVGDSATSIDAPPFSDEVATAAEPVASNAKRLGEVAAPPAPGPSLAMLAKAQPKPGQLGKPGLAAQPMAQPMMHAPAAMHAPAPVHAPETDEEEDLDIGEVSRVVNLADLLAKGANGGGNAARARTGQIPGTRGPIALGIGRTTGSAAAIANTTGSVARIDMATGMPIAPLAPGIDPATLSPLDPNYIPDAALAPPPATASTDHRRMYIMLAVGALLLIGIVVTVVFVTRQSDGPLTVGLRSGPDYNNERPEYEIRGKSNLDPNPVGSAAPQNPFVRPTGPTKPRITQTPQNPPPEVPTGNSLKAEEIEAMAKKYDGVTTRCFMRAGKGTNAITIGDVKRIVVTLNVEKDGAVSSVGLSDGHAGDMLGSCLITMIRSWKFRPNNGGTFRITVANPGS